MNKETNDGKSVPSNVLLDCPICGEQLGTFLYERLSFFGCAECFLGVRYGRGLYLKCETEEQAKSALIAFQLNKQRGLVAQRTGDDELKRETQ